MNFINSSLQFFISILNTVTLLDILDIVIVAYLIYKTVQLVRETRAEQLIKGIVLLIIAYYFSMLLNLKALSFILYNIWQFGVIALVVVFQPELRSALEHLGRTSVGNFKIFSFDNTEDGELKNKEALVAVCEAAEVLQKNRIGALILFERKTKLGEIIKTGTVINADISPEILVNVFYPKAPLHDGAMVIRNGKVFAAGCFLPLSQNQEVSRELGTRHRAALGISENSDVLVVVVSEETGIISLVSNGVIKRNLTIDTLRIALESGLLPHKAESVKKSAFRMFGR
ncbi:MAG TPA: diadenylate cyclase CdaA [Clostridia bacterium]|nr:diadenylate cyclase CdaA [Clostridia bacterium]